MCARGWRYPQSQNVPNTIEQEIIANITYKRWNPHRIKIVTHEFVDQGETLLQTGTMRGGKNSGDHVDILGNQLFIKYLMLIATGNKNWIDDHYESTIFEISDNVNKNLFHHYQKTKDKFAKLTQFSDKSIQSNILNVSDTVWVKWKRKIAKYFQDL